MRIQSPHQWYSIDREEVVKQPSGRAFLNYFAGDLGYAVENIYLTRDNYYSQWHPFHQRKAEEANKVGQSFWEEISHQRQFVEWLADHLDVSKPPTNCMNE